VYQFVHAATVVGGAVVVVEGVGAVGVGVVGVGVVEGNVVDDAAGDAASVDDPAAPTVAYPVMASSEQVPSAPPIRSTRRAPGGRERT
jgi:hypothetical protein